MQSIGVPLHCPELDLMPKQAEAIQLSKDMQQTLALLTGFWQNQRLLLKASPNGILFTTSPQIKDVFHVTATSDNYAYQGQDIKCSEVFVMGHPDNAGKIWVKPFTTAAIDNAWPLDAGDVWGFSLTNLNMLNMLIITNGEKAIVAYTL